jgi:dipeptidyl aminopeptidase/acylaminoacyl peptidase
MNLEIKRTCSALALLLLLPASSAVADGDVLTPEMVVDLSRVGSVALSPDAETVAYTLSVSREESDEPGSSYSELWVARVAGGEPRRFAGDKERIASPAWSPDGRLISFQVEREKDHEGVQVYAIPVDGGEARPLTEHDGSVSSHAWSPDGRWIAYAATDADTEEEEKDEKAGKDWQVFAEDPHFRHLWLLDVESGESRRLFAADLDAHEIHWTPDSRSLVFQATTTAQTDDEYMFSAIYRAPIEEDGEPIVLAPTVGKLGGMAVSPDGRHLAYLGATSLNDPLAQSLFVVSLDGGDRRNLTEGYEGSSAAVEWHDDRTVLLLAVEGERHALHLVDVASGERVPKPWPGLVAGALDYDGETGVLAVAAASSERPSDLFVADATGATPRRLSNHNPELDAVRLARQEVIEWTAADGWPIRGVLTYPRDHEEGRKYPLVLQVHGGPEGVSLDGWTTSSGYPVQLLAAAGYAVLQPNYRGSQGRGVAFSKADHDDLGGAEFDDILAGVDTLIAKGLVDPNRVGTGGWSYGGYMSAWAATRHSERFAASVVAAGLTNWVSFAGSTDIPYEMSLVHWDSWWFDEPELHWERSPIAHLGKAQTPTLVVTGAKDQRVHPEQAMELHTALRIKKVPTELVFYPREPHGLRERAHQLDFITRTLSWFDRYLAVPEVEDMEPRRD